MEASAFHNVKLPDGCFLRRKEYFEYVTANYAFDVELHENQDGTFYAIAVPRDTERVMVFGTKELGTAEAALKALVDKIRREESLIEPNTD
ncbi:hypothetical protein GI364_08165 [Alicyclobacillus sp. SO9]|nr:hypothetical protein [Alicyclobacillus sp. SO9]QQE80381.1 hypothetical protein GI364_08165 [Alicyclobacillus sp. SO9]